MKIDTQNIIKESIESTVIEYIAQKVIQKLTLKLNQVNKKALLVFTGSTKNLEQVLRDLDRLREEGWIFDIALSKSASNILNEKLLRELFNIDKIYVELDNTQTYELIQNHRLILIPTLTINTSSKIANCINDTMTTNIINFSLNLNKEIVICTDGCNPQDRKISTKHKNIISNNLQTINEFGIILIQSKDLYSSISNKFKIDYSHQMVSDSIYVDKRVISRMDIYDNRKSKNIKVSRKSIITDLAKEEASRLKINIIKI